MFLDHDLVIRGYTPATEAIYRLIPTDHGRPLTDIVCHLKYRSLRQDVRTVLETLTPLERQVEHEDGKACYIMRILPYRGNDGAVNGTLVTFVNVTSIVQAEKHQKLLVDELNHRVRNMLTVVISVATQTLRRSSSLAEFSEAFLGRVESLNASYTLLSRENWSDVALRDVIQQETQAFFDADRRNIVLDGPTVRLTPPGALAFGMALHELTTNAVKYGALSVPTGTVTVTWRLDDQAAGDFLVVDWIEQGGPPVQEPNKRGFGMTIIERGFAYELSGSSNVRFLPEGVHAELRAPVGHAIVVTQGERHDP